MKKEKETQKGKGEYMKAFLILEDGTVFTGTSIGSTKDMISEIVFNTSMTGYLEVLTDPSYAGQAVVMTYPLIGNYGITPDMESRKAWPDGYIVRELSRMPSNFRCEGTIQDFLKKYDIPGIAGVDTRALTKILREKGYRIEDFRSSQLTDEDLASADLVLAITKGLAEEIKESFDEATSCMSIGTFIDTTETEERIPEVTEENQETYQTCFDILEPLMEAVADRIIGELLV